jgi:hypothetical protein
MGVVKEKVRTPASPYDAIRSLSGLTWSSDDAFAKGRPGFSRLRHLARYLQRRAIPTTMSNATCVFPKAVSGGEDGSGSVHLRVVWMEAAGGLVRWEQGRCVA